MMQGDAPRFVVTTTRDGLPEDVRRRSRLCGLCEEDPDHAEVAQVVLHLHDGARLDSGPVEESPLSGAAPGCRGGRREVPPADVAGAR
jgi:hypothetical protein